MAKILIVDDSDAIRSQVRGVLEGAGHQVVEGCDGVDGLAKANSNTDVGLIICDYNMPNMDGLTMCSKVRENPALKATPIFMLTTESSPDMKNKGKEAGVLAWIVKPFNAEKTLAAITKILTRAA